MSKIPIVFLLSHLKVGGVETFSKNFARYINQTSDKYRAEILIVSNDVKYHHPDIEVNHLNVSIYDPFEKQANNLIKYINNYNKAVLFVNYLFNLQSVLPFFHEGIIKIFNIHTDQDEYYKSSRLFSSYYDHIVAVSHRSYKKILDMDKNLEFKTSMIAYGVKSNNYYKKCNIDDKKIKILYFGRLVEKQKKLSRMIDIAKELFRKKINFNWTFIGEGCFKTILEKRLHQEINHKCVEILSPMSQSQIEKIAIKSDIYILTSDYEGNPIALLEAMSYGCVPLVGKIDSGIPELIQNGINGFIVNRNSIKSYTDIIEYLYLNRDQLDRVSEQAYKKFRESNRTIDKMVKTYLSIINKISIEKINKKALVMNEPLLDYYDFAFPALHSVYDDEFLELKDVKNIAIFGAGISGKKTFHYLKDKYPEKKLLIIDDNVKGYYHYTKIVNSEVFVKKEQDKYEYVVFGKYQKVNPVLIKNLNIPHLRLINII